MAYKHGASTQRGHAGIADAELIIRNLKREINELRQIKRAAHAEAKEAITKAKAETAQAQHEAKQARQDAQMVIRKHQTKVHHTINKQAFDAAEIERQKALAMYPEPVHVGLGRLMEATAEIDDHNLRMRAAGLQRHLSAVA